MLGHYLRIALRNLLRHPLYSLINIVGLAVGLCSCLLIALFVRHEYSYDSFFADAQQIYRLSPHFAAGALGPERDAAGNVAPLLPLLQQQGITGVQAMTRLGGRQVMLAHNEQVFFEPNFRWADPELFQVFGFQWLQGNAATALQQPDTVVLTAKAARKYFGTTHVLGQTLLLENAWPLTVTGVIADLPDNTHLALDMVVPIATGWKVLDFDYSKNWSYTNFHTYVRLQPGAAIADVMQQINTVLAGAMPNIAPFFNITPATYKLVPYRVTDIHLGSGQSDDMKAAGSKVQVLVFSSIALCLLLVACINYMNLATARALQRSKEVGVRKVVGGSRTELMLQFLGESLLLTLLAVLLALAALELLLPVFSALVERKLAMATLLQPGYLALIAVITVATAVLAGGYPAFYMASLKPANELGAGRGAAGLRVRNTLVVLQFFLAITLMVATAVVFLQLRYARRIDLGFSKDQVLVLQGTTRSGMGAQWPVFKQQLLQHTGIAGVTEADMFPDSVGTRKFRYGGGPPAGFDMLSKAVGFGFFATYDMPLLAGRSFSNDFGTDAFNPPPNVQRGEQPTGNYMLSEAAVRALGWTPAQAIGKELEMDFSADFSLTVKGRVIGVVKDVHFQSLRNRIQPLVYFAPAPQWGNQPSMTRASIHLNGTDVEATLAYIRQQWKTLIPELPFVAHFLDADYAALYQNEERQGQLFSLFALLTIAIACLGLFGLATFTAERRRKEIGVRKVMGSSVLGIVLLLTNDFSKLVLLANLIAWPVAYFAMTRWLQNFAYRIDLTPLIFIGSGLIALCIAWVTVGGTAAKAASQKPVLALRYE